METLIGKTLGRYRLESSLGAGGMAEVLRAVDDRLGRAVAVKVVLPAYAGSEEFRQRFLREARLVATLEHPNVVPIYDFGEDGGLPFLVMPLFEGGALAARLDGSPLPPSQVVRWVRDLASALDAAHDAGVLHRDVKPSNVLIDRNGRALLADFGIALAAGVATRLTTTGTVIGTPGYMAPEARRGPARLAGLGPLRPCRPRLRAADRRAAVRGRRAPRGAQPARHPPRAADLGAAARGAAGSRPPVCRHAGQAPEERPASATEFAAKLERDAGWRRDRADSLGAPGASRPPRRRRRYVAHSDGATLLALTALSLDPAPSRRRNLLRALSAAALLLARRCRRRLALAAALGITSRHGG